MNYVAWGSVVVIFSVLAITDCSIREAAENVRIAEAKAKITESQAEIARQETQRLKLLDRAMRDAKGLQP